MDIMQKRRERLYVTAEAGYISALHLNTE